MVDHAATEALLRDSGLAFTALRNGFYTASGRMLLGRALETGEVAAPPDGPVSWTAHDDLADAAAIVLTDEGRFEGATPPLTGAAAVDLAGLAAIAAEVTGRPITRTVVTDAQYREQLGVPEPVADMLLGLFAASRAGAFAAVEPTLEQLLGRPPLTVREVLAKG
jgi:NAD(P)H dehydrogenase (quinone)